MNKLVLKQRAFKPKAFSRKEEGASLIEYAVIAALVVAIAVAGFATLGGGLEAAFENITATLTGAGN